MTEAKKFLDRIRRDNLPMSDSQIDRKAVEEFARLMSKRMQEQAKKGRHGWYDKTAVSVSEMQSALNKNRVNEDYLDVAVLAMMIHFRRREA